jgi:hypothetical protein
MKKTLAELISAVVNPIVISIAAVVLVSLETSSTIPEAYRWGLTLIGLCIIPVYISAYIMVKMGRLESIFDNSQERRGMLYLISIIIMVIAFITIYLLGAPRLMIATLFAILVAGLAFMLINLRWKISIHTAFAFGFVILLVTLYGWDLLSMIGIAVLVGWSRVELNQHTFGQTLAAAIITPIFLSSSLCIFGAI